MDGNTTPDLVRDAAGQPLAVGDRVAFTYRTGGDGSHHALRLGTIERITGQRVRIQIGHEEYVPRRFGQVCKVPTKSQAVNHDRLVAVCLGLYLFGRWTCEGAELAEQARMWEALRDVLGLEPGTATACGLGADS
jgi:hypothetical protein